ncbi:cysteine rich repeat-containing protein [Xanthobacter sp. DSM 24535]|uniref:cysteine rich repeat-containing protein n=1 Tax=Roseixanthobacter psychrophilus TaxID=3119917 RepID=UPI0037270CC9
MRFHVVTLALVSTIVFASAASAQQSDLATYCKADIQRLCKGVPPGEGRLMTCLKAHSKEMSVGCAQALQKMKKSM